MSNSAQQHQTTGEPDVIRFTARIANAAAKGAAEPALKLQIPAAVSQKLEGMTKLEGTINGHPFRAALEHDAAGGLWLAINKAMQKGAHAVADERVELFVLGPEAEPVAPSDLKTALGGNAAAKQFWQKLDQACRRDYIRWIVAAKKPETPRAARDAHRRTACRGQAPALLRQRL